jgi:hypothetical protein
MTSENCYKYIEEGIEHNIHFLLIKYIFPTFKTKIIVEDKIDYVKDGVYEELEPVFHKFPKYHMKILLGDFNAKFGMKVYTKLVMIMKLE